MTEYIVKSTCCFLILYLVYVGFFSNSRNYGINRIVLMVSVLFSILVPALKINPVRLPGAAIEQGQALQKLLTYQNTLHGSQTINVLENNGSTDLWEIVSILYILVSLLFLGRFIFNLSVLLIKSYKSEKIEFNGVKLALTEGPLNPFTFFNTVFISRSAFETKNIEEELILHELAHKEQLHSADVMILEFIQVFLWFNPFVYLFKSLIKANHEYLADDFVLQSGIACYDYSNKLINHTFRQKISGLESGFNHGFIKSRLLRLSKSDQKKRPSYQLSIFIALLMVLFTITAFKSPIASGSHNKSHGVFYADAIFWSAESKEIWLKGKMKVKFGQNDFTGDGSFSGFDKGSLLLIDGKKAPRNSSIIVAGKKCNLIILNKDEALAKYGADGKYGAVEITTSQ